MRIPRIERVQCPACRHIFKPFFVEKATRGAKRVSRGVIWAVSSGMLRLGTAVDYGCGLLRNTPFLEQHFRQVIASDTPIQCARLNTLWPDRSFHSCDDIQGPYDAVFLISVLHIIPEPEKRISILSRCLDLCGIDGRCVVEVPTWETYYRGKERTCGDGIESGNGQFPTFYKPFTATELAQLIDDAGGSVIAKHITKPTACYICEPKR